MHTINGYCILIDIKNSVDRKKVDKEGWVSGTTKWIRDFQRTVNEILMVDVVGTEVEHLKFLGDGLLVFLKTDSDRPDSKLSKKILKKMLEFSTTTKIKEDLEHPFVWRTVICYLKDITEVDISDARTLGHEQKELIGEGLDMAFRLQKYADTSHITVDSVFYNSVAREIGGLGLDSIPCTKTIKGWNREVEIYALTNPELIEKTILNNSPNSHFLDINLELFQYYLNHALTRSTLSRSAFGKAV